jgi:hypothetical protein
VPREWIKETINRNKKRSQRIPKSELTQYYQEWSSITGQHVQQRNKKGSQKIAEEYYILPRARVEEVSNFRFKDER